MKYASPLIILILISVFIGVFIWQTNQNTHPFDYNPPTRLVGVIEKDNGTTYNPSGCGYCFTSDDGSYKCAGLNTTIDLEKYSGKKVVLYGSIYTGASTIMCPISLNVESIELIG